MGTDVHAGRGCLAWGLVGSGEDLSECVVSGEGLSVREDVVDLHCKRVILAAVC